MAHPPARPDWWRWPTAALWLLFFVAGLFPERLFEELRHIGAVTTQDAYINSHNMITLGLVGFFMHFVYQRAREAGLDRHVARGKAVQVGILALVAFIPLRLDQAVRYMDIPVARLRHLVAIVAFGKIACWGYLFALLIRYYFCSGDRVFRQMPSLFPSAHLHRKADTHCAPATRSGQGPRASSPAPNVPSSTNDGEDNKKRDEIAYSERQSP